MVRFSTSSFGFTGGAHKSLVCASITFSCAAIPHGWERCRRSTLPTLPSDASGASFNGPDGLDGSFFPRSWIAQVRLYLAHFDWNLSSKKTSTLKLALATKRRIRGIQRPLLFLRHRKNVLDTEVPTFHGRVRQMVDQPYSRMKVARTAGTSSIP